MTVERRDALLRELEGARAAFRQALGDVDPDLLTAPGLMETWSARDLVAHVGFWSDHGARALELASAGRGPEFDYDATRTDAMNAEMIAAAAGMSPVEAADRESAAFDRFRRALAALAPGLLDEVLGNGDTVERVIRYDGPDHYAEHTEHLRAWFGGDEEPEDADDPGPT